MRNRGSSVLIEKNKVALIKRVKENCVYYVFPGGGIEEGETPEEATERETFEELGVKIKIKEHVCSVDFIGTQYFYLADIVGGTFGTGSGEEFTDLNLDRGTYQPLWMEIKNLSSLDVRPREVTEKIQSIFGKL
ncbi:MAG TPA: NUDIX domain-containing protein [Sporosarcina psychrophila]|uniref:NUDIX domain-containing protein n=1 Tax=Sporosarcina psychrophila TaxID=1476 RepID=A0A921G2I8_SPOPS|nr:NUDIX domain-containing protein [Sporosarcina psychrophila]